jgi:hypothetical protein
MQHDARPMLRVVRSKEGIWSVNERGPNRTAVAYFPSQWGAMKHAVRVAKAKRRCRVAVIGGDGAVRLARDYDGEGGGVETP